VPLTDETSVLVVEIRPTPGRGPHQYDGRYLMRSADGNASMLHSNVVRAVMAASESPHKPFGPPESGFGYIHPFGAESGTGWFFGVQLVIAHLGGHPRSGQPWTPWIRPVDGADLVENSDPPSC